PDRLNSVSTQHHDAFVAYLTGKQFAPANFGASTWDNVNPIGYGDALTAGTLEARKLYYWTTRFFSESASNGHLLAKNALEQALGHPLNVDVNLNTGWYNAAPNQTIGNNPVVGPDSAMGGFDWFTSGRMSAHTLWSEDWFDDSHAGLWVPLATALKSA